MVEPQSNNNLYVRGTKDGPIPVSSEKGRPRETSFVLASRNNYNEVVPGLTTRSPFSYEDIAVQRPEFRIPTKFPDIIRAGRNIYLTKSVVRQVVDLQVDFVFDGFSITHTDPSTSSLIDVWMRKCKLKEAVSEYIKHLILDHNVIVRRYTAKLTNEAKNKWMEIAARPDEKISRANQRRKFQDLEIPIKYKFLDPAYLKWDENDQLKYKVDLGILRTKIKDKVHKLPPEVQRALKNSSDSKIEVTLDMTKVYVAHMKKDCWDEWAIPSLYSVMPDIIVKDKLRQAEIAALDGVINVIRLWKIGDHKTDIFPTPKALDDLQRILEANTGGGALDVIWDSAIEMQEYYPPTDKILGPAKYERVDRDILIGLGVPEVLIGGKGANFSNSFIQLKTLVEKLEDVRQKVLDWLYVEFSIFCESLGIKEKPTIKFKQMMMYDENVYRQLLIQLADRGIISTETLLDRFDEDLGMELIRLEREMGQFKNPAQQENDDKPIKLGPYSNVVDKENLIEPTENNGRPANTKDGAGRKPRTPGIRADSLIYAQKSVEKVYSYVTDFFMDKKGIKNARMLSAQNRSDIDSIVKCVLSCINSYQEVDETWIETTLADLKTDTKFLQSVSSKQKETAAQSITDIKAVLTAALIEKIR
jgi:hypothetical protein